MKILTSLWLLLFSANLWACGLQKDVKSIVSLSGPVTIALRELNLLNHPAVKAISVFHPVSSKAFRGELLPGGIMLSREKLIKYQDGVIFYDESRQLKKMLSLFHQGMAIELTTRGLLPLEAHHLVLEQLKPWLKDCDEAIRSFQQKVSSAQNKIKKLASGKKVIFYLGEIQFGRYPELLMVQDGVVKWMLQEKMIQTYPSQFAYVNWSAKIVAQLSTYLKVGIKDTGSSLIKKISKDEKGINFSYPGALIPGLGQLEGMAFLFEGLSE